MLVRLLYASRAAASLDESVIDNILAQCRRNNPRLGITGILCHSGARFIQVLEGGRDQVCDLYNSLTRDPRHAQLRILRYEEIDERRFGGWTMGEVDIERVNPALLLKYAERPELDPASAPGHASMALLEELIATNAVVSRAV